MKTQIIQLDAHDDLISARDKMSWSKAPRILLVWPLKGKLLERTVDLLLLQRCAQHMGAQLGIVTGNLAIQGQARQLGIPCFRGAGQAQKQPWRRHGGRKRLNLHLLERQPMAESLRRQFNGLAAERAGMALARWTRAGVFSLGILSVLALVLLFAPAARIEIRPVRQEQKLEIALRASPDIPAANLSGGIPATVVSVTVEGSDQERSSGTAAVPDRQATGTIELSNLGAAALTIPKATVVSTLGEEGVRFETLADVKIAAGVGSEAQVRIRALAPGASGNVEAGAILAMEGEMGLAVSVVNPAATSGGSDRTSPGPRAEDYAKVRERLVKTLSETARADLLRNLEPGQRLLEPSIRIVEVIQETQALAVGQPGDFAGLTMRIEFGAWTVREEDLQAVAQTALDANPLPGFAPEKEPATILFLTQPVEQKNGSLHWTVLAVRKRMALVNPEQAARAAAGKRPGPAGRALQEQYLLDAPAFIEVSPRWWFWLPFLPSRISVEVN